MKFSTRELLDPLALWFSNLSVATRFLVPSTHLLRKLGRRALDNGTRILHIDDRSRFTAGKGDDPVAEEDAVSTSDRLHDPYLVIPTGALAP